MKVLSLTEPYATLILKGYKTIETRSWKTFYRGKLYIHASSTRIPARIRENKELFSMVNPGETHPGYILCSCILSDCIEMTDEFIETVKKNPNEYTSGIYEKGRYAWILKDIVALNKPIKAKGRLGIWELEE